MSRDDQKCRLMRYMLNMIAIEFVNVVHVLNKLNVINSKQMNDLMKEYLI